MKFVHPWNSGPWRFPSFTRVNGKPVALSFGRAAIVFDMDWWRDWMKGSTK